MCSRPDRSNSVGVVKYVEWNNQRQARQYDDQECFFPQSFFNRLESFVAGHFLLNPSASTFSAGEECELRAYRDTGGGIQKAWNQAEKKSGDHHRNGTGQEQDRRRRDARNVSDGSGNRMLLRPLADKHNPFREWQDIEGIDQHQENDRKQYSINDQFVQDLIIPCLDWTGATSGATMMVV